MNRGDFIKHPPPSLGNKVQRAIWLAFYFSLFRLSPTPFHFWRRVVLRLFGAKVGRSVLVYPSVVVWAPWNIELEDFSTIGGGVNLYAVAKIHVGQAAIVSQRAHICTASHDFDSEQFDLVTAKISIENNAWVAAEAFIGPGVTIGENAVIGARSVVTKSVDPNVVMAGNPARRIRQRSEQGRNILANQNPDQARRAQR